MNLLPTILKLFLEIAKIELTSYYAKAIGGVHRLFMVWLATAICVMTLVCGFIMIHVALFIYLPWDLEVKALAFVILGLVYFFVPMGIILWLHSRRQWLKRFSASS